MSQLKSPKDRRLCQAIRILLIGKARLKIIKFKKPGILLPQEKLTLVSYSNNIARIDLKMGV